MYSVHGLSGPNDAAARRRSTNEKNRRRDLVNALRTRREQMLHALKRDQHTASRRARSAHVQTPRMHAHTHCKVQGFPSSNAAKVTWHDELLLPLNAGRQLTQVFCRMSGVWKADDMVRGGPTGRR